MGSAKNTRGVKNAKPKTKFVIELTDKTFDDELDCDDPVLVDFWAPWCGPCLQVAPVVEALAEAYDGKMKFGKIDIDKQPKTADKFGITSIPTMLIFKDGKVVGQLVGAAPKSKIEAVIKKHVEVSK